MKLSALFDACLHAPYIHTENGGDFYLLKEGSTLFIYLEASNGAEDWKNNLDFPAKAHSACREGSFFAHRGFLRVFESVLPHIAPAVADQRIHRICIVGYSHGGALALLCYNYVLCARPDLCEAVDGYGFGAPRVLWGCKTRALRRRFSRFTVIRNQGDIVTHLPPAALGYFHAGKMLTLGEKKIYGAMDAHRPENLLAALKKAGL